MNPKESAKLKRQVDLIRKGFVRESMSPFEKVTGYNPNKPIDLIPLPVEQRLSEHASSFAQHMRDLHHEI